MSTPLGFVLALFLGGCSDAVPSPGPGTRCADGEVDDGGACVPEACGIGTWGTIEGATVFVDLAAADGGDGSQDAPFRSIQEGADAAGDAGGGVVAVAAGTYAENLVLEGSHDGVEIAGRCAELVVVDGSGGGDDQSSVELSSRSAEVVLRGLTVTGGPYVGVVAWAGTLRVSDAVITGNSFIGVAAVGDGANVELVGTTVSDTHMREDGIGGRGIHVQDGATLRAEECLVIGNHEVGVLAANGGSLVELMDTTISDTQMVEDGTFGRGIHVEEGATIQAEACTVTGNHDIGVFARNVGTTVELTQSTVSNTRMIEDGTGGRGIVVQDGATLRADVCTVSGNHEVGVYALDAATTVELVGTSISDTQTMEDGTSGVGIYVGAGAELRAEACTVSGNHEAGVAVLGEGARVELVATTVSDTQMFGGGEAGVGVGIGVGAGADLRAEACVVTGNTEVGVSAADMGTTVELVNTTVSDTRMLDNGTRGRGINVQDGATLLAEACLVSENHEVGVYASGEDTTVELVDSTVSMTRPSQGSTMGSGIVVQEGALLVGTRLDSMDNHGPGLYSVDDGARLSCSSCTVERNAFAGAIVVSGAALELTDSNVADNQPSGQEGGGLGIFAWDFDDAPASLHLSGTTVGPHAYAAVWLQGPGNYVLEDNELSGGEGQSPTDWVHLHGDAVYATGGVTAWDEDSQTGLLLQGNNLRDSAGAGLFLDGAIATLSDNTWTGNATDLVQQRCEATVALAEDDVIGVPTLELCPAENHAVTELEYALILVEADLEYE